MVRIDVVRDKLRRLRATLAALARTLPDDPSALGDRDVLDLLSFRVYLAIQEAVDVASHLIADEGWGPAPSLREHFEILAERGVIESSLAQELASGVKVRNLIAHGYAAVDPQKLHAAAKALQPIGDRYCVAVLLWSEHAASQGRT